MTKFEFFFDVSSPWTYLAFSQVESVAARCGVDIIWKPILVGGVFNSVNETVYEQRANLPRNWIDRYRLYRRCYTLCV